MLRTATSLAALTLVAALALTGCAAEQAPAQPSAKATSTPSPTPEPTVAAGDVVTPEQVEKLVASGDIIAGYPVGDELIAVQWGVAIPEKVRQSVNENVNSTLGSTFGTTSDVATSAGELSEALKAEGARLGGISMSAVACLQSFSTATNSFQPTWVISEPGPHGEYDSFQHAIDTANAWQDGRNTGRNMYVVINNLGCAQ